jgi:hypothetical protein
MKLLRISPLPSAESDLFVADVCPMACVMAHGNQHADLNYDLGLSLDAIETRVHA